MSSLKNNQAIISEYFNSQFEIEQLILSVLENDEYTEENFTNLGDYIIKNRILHTKNELLLLLKCIISISNNHKRSENFFYIIEKILINCKNELHQYFQNIELFNLFKTNKRILLFLFQERLIIPDDAIFQIISREQNPFQNYLSYFSLEFKDFDLSGETIENQDNYDMELFNDQRLLGENNDFICELIRKDSIDEFSLYIEQGKCQPSSHIPPSIFETNHFLIDKSPNLIEYSAFFGSFNIFNYLVNQNVVLTPSLWIYAIHGQNEKIIKILENKKIEPESYIKCFVESIKCHHRGFILYFQNYINMKENTNYFFNKFIKYYNFSFVHQYFEDFLINFYNSCTNEFFRSNLVLDTFLKFYQYDYVSVVKLVLNSIEFALQLQIQSKTIHEMKFKNQKNQNNYYRMMDNDMSECFLRVFNICILQNEIIDMQNTKINILENENKSLIKKNKILKMNKRNTEIKYQNEIRKNRLLIGKLKKTNIRLYELQKKVNELSENKNESECVEHGPMTLTSSIISELIKNENINIHSRKYSDYFKDICFLLFINSNITYKLLRKFLPLPDPDHLRKSYSYTMKIKKQNLLNKNQIEYLLHEMHKELTDDENEKVIMALGFDAATIDPRDQGSIGLFLFNGQPVNSEQKSQVIHVQPHKNGKANKSIMETVDNIKKAGENANIIFKFIVSDSDSATNQIHIDFQEYIRKFKGEISYEFLEYIGNYSKPIPISDWLHLLKNLRTRIVDNTIILFKNSEIIDIFDIEKLLNLDKAVARARGRATMRDDLAIKLINDQNLTLLGENNRYCCLILLLPFVLFTMVIQSDNLSIDSRIKLSLLSYDIIVNISKESEKLPEQKSKYTDNVSYLLTMMKTRTLNTIIGIAFALKDYGEHIMTSRLGTHIIEYIFGRMRNGCGGFDSLNQCVYQLVKTEISQEILKKFNKNDIPIVGRSHPGGSSFCEKWNTEIDAKINLNKITDECKQLIHHNISYSGTNVEKLINFLSEKTPLKIPNLRGSIVGSKITARQINYQNKQ